MESVVALQKFVEHVMKMMGHACHDFQHIITPLADDGHPSFTRHS